MTENNKYKELFETAQVEQLKQMRANEHKSGWDGGEDINFLTDQMNYNIDRYYDEKSKEGKICRLANIMNFAAMGILNLKGETNGRD